jgi:hypothetical protein
MQRRNSGRRNRRLDLLRHWRSSYPGTDLEADDMSIVLALYIAAAVGFALGVCVVAILRSD